MAYLQYSWLRDYLYISLEVAGWIAKDLPKLAADHVLGGLWHGAAWNFVIWGALHGSALAIERFAAQQLNISGVLIC